MDLYSDMLMTTLALLFTCGVPPDELSQEWVGDDDTAVIRLRWWSGHQRDYAYTAARFEAAMMYFEAQWQARATTVADATIAQARFG